MNPFTSTPSKTVYILGAGFSRCAGFPLQAEILQRADRLGMMDAPLEMFKSFLMHYDRWREFRNRTFPIRQTPTLEEVFTLLDETVSGHGFCSGYSFDKLEKVTEALRRVILFVFHVAGEKVSGRSAGFYRSVAAHLLDRRGAAGQGADPLSVICLNWDCLLEKAIYWCIGQANALKRADIDYCCYTTPLTDTCPHTPSLLQKAKGLFNFKIMKLHGSANWLLCPNCNRLYTGVGGPERVWEQYVQPQACPSCQRLLSRETDLKTEDLPQLEPFFITPTFVKIFDNPHIQMTWHNAYVNLGEATEIVFIGYSLPLADYHFRTLLRRAVRPEASITVVLTLNDKVKSNTPRHLRPYFAETRYREFFGSERVMFDFGGMEAYFRRVMGRRRLADQINLLGRHLKE